MAKEEEQDDRLDNLEKVIGDVETKLSEDL